MPDNKNDWVRELLSWQSHDSVGVRVPFVEGRGNPLDRTLPTPLIRKLRGLIQSIKDDEESPRWVFLIGGPGNGKSEAVQDFVETLDEEFNCDRKLVELAKKAFNDEELARCVFDVKDDELQQSSSPELIEKIGRLIIIQDASASSSPNKNAAENLVNTLTTIILDLITHKEPPPLFVACINRGLLARAVVEAQKLGDDYKEVKIILKKLIHATDLGQELISGEQLECWPLVIGDDPNLDGKIACWPLDLESLFLSPEHGGSRESESPFGSIVEKAVKPEEWNDSETCQTCSSEHLCPFYANAKYLRERKNEESLKKILRRSEFALSQRWNFRYLYSLVAELIAGSTEDFRGWDHPCSWVHENKNAYSTADNLPGKLKPILKLLSKLYYHSLFPGPAISRLSDHLLKSFETKIPELAKSINVIHSQITLPVNQERPIRKFLAGEFSRQMDPIFLSPHDQGDIGNLEDMYSQSINLGNSGWPESAPMHEIEKEFFGLTVDLESDLGELELERSSYLARKAEHLIRVTCSALAKRSVGVQLGHHNKEKILESYENCIRDENKLFELAGKIREIMGGSRMRFNHLESFGQPDLRSRAMISLSGSIEVMPPSEAPKSTSSKPAHDLPHVMITGQRLHLTFNLFEAITLTSNGCSENSLPASTRGVLDRIRHLNAGEISHADRAFISRNSRIELLSTHDGSILGEVILQGSGSDPKFKKPSNL